MPDRAVGPRIRPVASLGVGVFAVGSLLIALHVPGSTVADGPAPPPPPTPAPGSIISMH